jgi:sugar O-acyltransferase (sialic acid O-acetyltransferase NeuD family)
MNSEKLIIVGGGGLGREVVWAARESRENWYVSGFLDDSVHAATAQICGLPILGSIDDWRRFSDHHFVVAIGSPRARQAVVARMELAGKPKFGTVVHRNVGMSDYVSVGAGSVICSHVSATTQIVIGQHAIINLNCSIGHDCDIGDFTTFAPLVACSGGVVTEPGVEIGTGAAIRQGLRLGRGSMLGMGSVLTKDIPPDRLWLGNPAGDRRELESFSA